MYTLSCLRCYGIYSALLQFWTPAYQRGFYVITHVYWSVTLKSVSLWSVVYKYLRDHPLFFLIFCMKFGHHKGTNVTEINFLCGLESINIVNFIIGSQYQNGSYVITPVLPLVHWLVCLLVCESLNISETVHSFFKKNCKKLGHHNGIRVTESDFFKNLRVSNWGKLNFGGIFLCFFAYISASSY